MKLKFTLRGFAALVLASTLAAGTFSCNEDNAKTGDGLELRYPGVTNIGPGITVVLPAPSYLGSAQPSGFTISGITLDGAAFTPEQGVFTMNASTGKLKIEDPDKTLLEGTYVISVDCTANGGMQYSYPQAITIVFSRSTPMDVLYAPNELTVPFGETFEDSYLPDTAYIVSMGPSVTVTKYELVQEVGKKYFKVDPTNGNIYLDRNIDIPAGIYPVTLKMSNASGSQEYPGVVTYNITSAPQAITYTPDSEQVETNAEEAWSSEAPVVTGTQAGLQFAISAITPATDQITINSSTGILSIPARNTLTVDQDYVVDVTVTNAIGSETFTGAYTVEVLSYINPISGFSYPATSMLEKQKITIDKTAAGFVGDYVTYSLVSETLPAALNNQVTVNSASGQVTIAKNNTIPKSATAYPVQIRASNSKGNVTATLSLTVNANPNMFTYVRYGNNLGLPNDGTYADQFVGGSTIGAAAPTRDGDQGLATKYELVRGIIGATNDNTYTIPATCTINATTGAITNTAYITNGGSGSQGTAVVLVKATVGTDPDTNISVFTPVFFRRNMTGESWVTFVPFAVKMNPKTGKAQQPTMTIGTTGVTDTSKFLIDFRKQAQYLDFNNNYEGIAGWTGIVTDANTAMNRLWASVGAVTGTKGPMGYFKSGSEDVATLSEAFWYFDNSTPGSQTMKINANKLMLDGIYLKGIIRAAATMVNTGLAANLTGAESGASQVCTPFNGIILWVDPDHNIQ